MNNYGRARIFGGSGKKKVTKVIQQKPVIINQPKINKNVIMYEDAYNDNSSQQSEFKKIVKGIIGCLPCSDAEKDELITNLESYNMKFPEYCQCHANETLDEDCPVDSWLASLYTIVLAIRDNI